MGIRCVLKIALVSGFFFGAQATITPAPESAKKPVFKSEVSFLEDPEGRADISRITGKDTGEFNFMPVSGNYLQSGFDMKTAWLKIRIVNNSRDERSVRIILMHGKMDHVEFFERREKSWVARDAGYLKNPVYDFIHFQPAHTVHLSPNADETVYVKMTGPYFKGGLFYLVDETEAEMFLVSRTAVFGLLTVVTLILLLLTLYNYFIFKNTTYLWYSGYIFFIWILFTLPPGIYASYLAAIPLWITERFLIWTAFASSFFHYTFIRSFLQLRLFSPIPDLLLRLVAWFMLLASLVLFTPLSLDQSLLLYNLGSIVSVLVIAAVILLNAIKGHRLSRLAFLPGIFAMIVIFINNSVYIGIVPPSFITINAAFLMLPLELVIFFIAQHVRIKNLLMYYQPASSPRIELPAPSNHAPESTTKNIPLAGDVPPAQSIEKRKTYLKPEQVGNLVQELNRIMQEEKLYQVEDLRAPQLAAAMGIKTHHLTELLNLHLKTSFVQMIKKYRVEESMQLIRATPDRTVLEIAFETGFQSKSVFNAAFKEITGMTPAEYRSTLAQNN